MTKVPLAKMERITDLRAVWGDEAGDFIPWLARQENLALLGETLGLDLELEQTEQHVGGYRADIVCRETVTNERVLIENQLETTDHGHLGQVFTYAAGINAPTIVWIARRFTNEHRAALDWLNEITSDDVSFFGIEVELWRIGDSPIAPKFNIVSKPNEWTKAGRHTPRQLTAVNQQVLEYWRALQELALSSKTISLRTAPAGGWARFAIGTSKCHLASLFTPEGKQITVGLYLLGIHAKRRFYALQDQKEEIGSELEWLELPGSQQSRVYLHRKDVVLSNPDLWPKLQSWHLKTLEAFHAAFAERIKAIPLDNDEPA